MVIHYWLTLYTGKTHSENVLYGLKKIIFLSTSIRHPLLSHSILGNVYNLNLGLLTGDKVGSPSL